MENLQLLPFVQTQQGVAVNAEHLAIGKCTQQGPFFTATYVVRLMPLRRATQIPLNRLWSMGMFFCNQAMKSPRPVWAFGVNDWSSVGPSFISFMMFLLLKILQMAANPSQVFGPPLGRTYTPAGKLRAFIMQQKHRKSETLQKTVQSCLNSHLQDSDSFSIFAVLFISDRTTV